MASGGTWGRLQNAKPLGDSLVNQKPGTPSLSGHFGGVSLALKCRFPEKTETV